MPNTAPIFSRVGNVNSAAGNNSGLVVGPTANTAMDGSGTLYKIFTADASAGSFVQKVRFRPVATSAVAATVGRLFISTSAVTTATNTWLFDEVTLPLTSISQTVANPIYELPVNVALPAGYSLWVTFGTTTGAAGQGYSVVAVGGDY